VGLSALANQASIKFITPLFLPFQSQLLPLKYPRAFVTMASKFRYGMLSKFLLLLPLICATTHAQPVEPRVVPLPPSTYVHGAKIATKIIILLVITLTVSTIVAVLACYCCCKRRKARARKRRLDKERAGSKQLRPRINGRNAKFFAPGLVDVELEDWKKPELEIREVRRPGKAWLGGRWGRRMH